jgi:Holliday junction resolvase-like predicted endonuclease|tara:strand:- start:92 stop:397 length:306 start_codon:yes stop_codon:yes gene_type:complete
MVPHSKLPKIKKGMVAEQIAIQYLLEKGFFVFKNLYGVGPADLIAINEKGKVNIYDVKSESYRKTWKPGTRIPRALTLEQRKLKMQFIFVDKDGTCKVRQR